MSLSALLAWRQTVDLPGTSKRTGIGQGYGWQMAEAGAGPQWRQAGGDAGFESLHAVYPAAGIAVVVLGNRKDGPRVELERRLRGTALAMFTCRDLPGAY